MDSKLTKNIAKYSVVGLMSGTSLDGLDIVACEFFKNEQGWNYSVMKGVTVQYPQELLNKLEKCIGLSGEELILLDIELGAWYGDQVNLFLANQNVKVDFVASHGHTVFHQPENNMTLQIGNGHMISIRSQLPVIADFRSKDVALGGQGAPLVPVGDLKLFGEYAICLNLGGIANMSFDNNKSRIAFDVCPCNMLLNRVAKRLGKAFDEGGRLASSGQVIESLLTRMDWDFYKQPWPKSLGYEAVSQNYFELIEDASYKPEDVLATLGMHIGQQIGETIGSINKIGKLLITGGGAYNKYLIACISKYLPESIQIEIPDPVIIDFKEAIVFGFLGVLRMREEVNCLSSVTGASRDSVGGVIYQ